MRNNQTTAQYRSGAAYVLVPCLISTARVTSVSSFSLCAADDTYKPSVPIFFVTFAKDGTNEELWWRT